MADHDVDLFVIGGGSVGVRAARIASSHGARVMIAEEYRAGRILDLSLDMRRIDEKFLRNAAANDTRAADPGHRVPGLDPYTGFFHLGAQMRADMSSSKPRRMLSPRYQRHLGPETGENAGELDRDVTPALDQDATRLGRQVKDFARPRRASKPRKRTSATARW